MVFKIRIGFGLDHFGSDSDFKIYQLSDWELPIRSDAHLYSRFQITFHCDIPNFVAKFASSLRSSKVHFRIHEPVCKQRL